MNILPQKVRGSRKAILGFLVAIILLLGCVAILERLQITDFVKLPSNKSEPQLQAEATKKENQKTKQDFIEGDSEPEPRPTAQDASAISLTVDQDSQGVTLLTKLTDIPSGLCNLRITNGSKSHTVDAPVIYQPEFSSCAGFTIAKNKLGSGTWKFDLTITLADSTPLSKSVTYEVE